VIVATNSSYFCIQNKEFELLMLTHFVCCQAVVYRYLYLIFTWNVNINISDTEIAAVQLTTLIYCPYFSVSFTIRTSCQIKQNPSPTIPCIYVLRKVLRTTTDHFHKQQYKIFLSAALIERESNWVFIINWMLFVLKYFYVTFFESYCNSVSPGTVPARITTPS
jgi:hypothetical protein